MADPQYSILQLILDAMGPNDNLTRLAETSTYLRELDNELANSQSEIARYSSMLSRERLLQAPYVNWTVLSEMHGYLEKACKTLETVATEVHALEEKACKTMETVATEVQALASAAAQEPSQAGLTTMEGPYTMASLSALMEQIAESKVEEHMEALRANVNCFTTLYSRTGLPGPPGEDSATLSQPAYTVTEMLPASNGYPAEWGSRSDTTYPHSNQSRKRRRDD